MKSRRPRVNRHHRRIRRDRCRQYSRRVRPSGHRQDRLTRSMTSPSRLRAGWGSQRSSQFGQSAIPPMAARRRRPRKRPSLSRFETSSCWSSDALRHSPRPRVCRGRSIERHSQSRSSCRCVAGRRFAIFGSDAMPACQLSTKRRQRLLANAQWASMTRATLLQNSLSGGNGGDGRRKLLWRQFCNQDSSSGDREFSLSEPGPPPCASSSLWHSLGAFILSYNLTLAACDRRPISTIQ